MKIVVQGQRDKCDSLSKWVQNHPALNLYFASSREELNCLVKEVSPHAVLTETDLDRLCITLLPGAYMQSHLSKYRGQSGERIVRAVTFGRFDLFSGNECVRFSCRKSKELLALCVDRCGGLVTMEEAIDKLWPERVYDHRVKQLYRKAVCELRKVFERIGLSEAFVTGRGNCFIQPEYFQCDYFDFLKGIDGDFPPFYGEYLYDFSWAEETLAKLEYIISLRKEK